MHKSKFLALLLAIAMVVSMVVVPVYAEGDLSEYTLTADKTTVAPGDTVTVTLAVNAANLAAADLSVNYDETVTLTGSTSELAGLVLSPEDKLSAPQKVILTTLTPLEGNVKLVTYTFAAPAEEGEYAITVTADELSNLNLDGDLIAPTYGDELVITVLKNACPEHNAVKDWTLVDAETWKTDDVIKDTVITSGHYKLTADLDVEYLQAAAADPDNALVIGENQEVCIDLNGHTISAKRAGSTWSTRVFRVLSGAKLTILDSATGGTISNGRAGGRLAASANGGAGIDVDGRGGNIYVQSGATFTLVSGTITGGCATCGTINAYNRGGNIYGEAGSTINIKGGTVSNGEINRASGARGYQYAQQSGGGNIATEGTLNITGGTITGGNVYGEYETVYADDGVTISKAYCVNIYGGNIMVLGTGTVNISNATITNGTVDTKTDNVSSSIKAGSGGSGGNIYVEGADLVIDNATISNGLISVGLNQETVSTGYYEVLGGNIAIRNGDLTVAGASTVSGGQINFPSTIRASFTTANTQVKGASVYSYGGDVIVKDTAKLEGGKLWDPATEAVHPTAGGYIHGANLVAEAASTGFVVESHDDAEINNGEGGYKYGYALYAKNHDVKVYGGNIRNTGYEGTYTTYMYDGRIDISMSGYRSHFVYPTADGAHCHTGGSGWWTMKAWHTNLGANGYCAACDYYFTSPQEQGNHTYVEDAENAGHYACSACGAALTCSNPDHADATWTVWDGTVASLNAGGHFFMNGDLSHANSTNAGRNVSGTVCLDMNGYTFTDTDASRTFQFQADSDVLFQNGTLNLPTGGYIGAFTTAACKLTMKGINFVVTGTTSDCSGGGIFNIAAGCEANFENCSFTSPGFETTKGGAIFVAGGTPTFTNCTFNVDQAAYGAGVYVNGGTVTMTDCVFNGGEATQSGGNMYITNAAAVVNLDGCKFVDGKAVLYGGNIALGAAATLNLTDCELTGGTVAGTGNQRGGNLYSATNGAKIVIDGGVIADGVAGAEGTTNGRGGNIFIQRGWDTSDHYALTVTGGAVIKNGTATQDGGNISGVYTSFDLDDCMIFGGTASEGDNICTTSSGEGCTVIFGATTKVYDGTVVLVESSTSEDYPATYTFESGAQVGDLVVESSNMVVNAAANVTYTGDVLPGVTSHFDGETETYVTMAALADAIAAVAGEGDKVVLGKAETADVNVEGYTLDLNGQTLTGNVAAADSASKVIDSTEGVGLVTGTVNLFADNGGYLPVNTEAGYKFETVSLRQATQELDGGKLKLKIAFNDAADETLLDEVFANATTTPGAGDVQVIVTVTYAGGEVTAQYDYDLLNLYASAWGSKMFTCTITNNNDVAIESITASVCSNGVEIAAADVTK